MIKPLLCKETKVETKYVVSPWIKKSAKKLSKKIQCKKKKKHWNLPKFLRKKVLKRPKKLYYQNRP